jgi:hypothetical protein
MPKIQKLALQKDLQRVIEAEKTYDHPASQEQYHKAMADLDTVLALVENK